MKKLIDLVLLFTLVSLSVSARENVAKEFHEKYNTDKNTNFTVSNIYGNIEIVNTESDVMSIDVYIKVEASNERKAQDILDDIEIQIEKIGNNIVAKTNIEASNWKNVKVNIDYKVSMPEYVNTALKCRYGNVSVEKVTGHFDAEVKYGSFAASVLIPSDAKYTNDLAMKYCDDVIIKAFSKMSLYTAYSDVKLGVGEKLNFENKYSDVSIGNVDVADVYTAYGDIEIDKIGVLVIEGRYSDIDLGLLKKRLELDTSYGDVDINKVANDFDLIKVDGRYADIDVAIEKGAEYRIKLETSYADMSFPKMYVVDVDNEGNSQSLNGYVGNENAKGMIDIDTAYGDINVEEAF